MKTKNSFWNQFFHQLSEKGFILFWDVVKNRGVAFLGGGLKELITSLDKLLTITP